MTLMKDKSLSLLFDLQRVVVDMALINRHHYLTGQERSESNIDHSYAVAMLCWFIFDKYSVKLSLEKILIYALIHDLPEVYAGDVHTFADQQAREQKIVREHQATNRLVKEFKDFPSLADALKHYEAQADDEARFVWTVDKMQALILGAQDEWRPYREGNINYKRFAEKYSEIIAKGSPYAKEIFTALLDYVSVSYYDQPSA